MTSQFYRSRPKPADAPTGEAYWVKKDPDGVMRDMQSEAERDQKVLDAWDEVRWLMGCRPVLDVGCGTGALLRQFGPDGIGLEPDEWAAVTAERYTARPVYASWDVMMFARHDGMTGLPREFAGILCYHVLEHIENPLEALRLMHAALAEGGRIVVSTPDFDSPVARRWGENYRLLQDPTHISLFSTASLVAAMQHAGFHIERVEHPWPERFRTPEHVLRLLDDPKTTISPPAPGNVVSVYGVRP